jgi:hypothetical protein
MRIRKRNKMIVWLYALASAAMLLAACSGGADGVTGSYTDGGNNGSYTVGGTVSGLGAGNFLVLQNNGGDDLNVTANGAFSFATPVTDGAGYIVTVLTQPAGQTCTVNNGTGIISGASPSNITVSCSTGSGTGSIAVYTGSMNFDLATGASGTADVTWTRFEDLGDTRRYLPSGTMLVDFNVSGCDPLLGQTIPIATSTAASPAETLVVYTSANTAYPQQYQFTLNGDSNVMVTLHCSGPTADHGRRLRRPAVPVVHRRADPERVPELQPHGLDERILDLYGPVTVRDCSGRSEAR